MAQTDQGQGTPEQHRLHLGLSGKLLGLTIVFVMIAVSLRGDRKRGHPFGLDSTIGWAMIHRLIMV